MGVHHGLFTERDMGGSPQHLTTGSLGLPAKGQKHCVLHLERSLFKPQRGKPEIFTPYICTRYSN